MEYISIGVILAAAGIMYYAGYDMVKVYRGLSKKQIEASKNGKGA
jgi:hypothetical protein